MMLTRFGGDLLSHDLSRSTIGAVALNGRVRKGTGCFAHAMTTKPSKECVVRVLCTLVFVLLVVVPVVVSDLVLFHGLATRWHLRCSAIVPLIVSGLWTTILLLLDQIKPIGRLVPVS